MPLSKSESGIKELYSHQELSSTFLKLPWAYGFLCVEGKMKQIMERRQRWFSLKYAQDHHVVLRVSCSIQREGGGQGSPRDRIKICKVLLGTWVGHKVVIVLIPSFCLFPSQFCLSKADKEQYEKEERPESQQEILRRAAKDLPIYTTTASRGEIQR